MFFLLQFLFIYYYSRSGRFVWSRFLTPHFSYISFFGCLFFFCCGGGGFEKNTCSLLTMSCAVSSLESTPMRMPCMAGDGVETQGSGEVLGSGRILGGLVLPYWMEHPLRSSPKSPSTVQERERSGSSPKSTLAVVAATATPNTSILFPSFHVYEEEEEHAAPPPPIATLSFNTSSFSSLASSLKEKSKEEDPEGKREEAQDENKRGMEQREEKKTNTKIEIPPTVEETRTLENDYSFSSFSSLDTASTPADTEKRHSNEESLPPTEKKSCMEHADTVPMEKHQLATEEEETQKREGEQRASKEERDQKTMASLSVRPLQDVQEKKSMRSVVERLSSSLFHSPQSPSAMSPSPFSASLYSYSNRSSEKDDDDDTSDPHHVKLPPPPCSPSRATIEPYREESSPLLLMTAMEKRESHKSTVALSSSCSSLIPRPPPSPTTTAAVRVRAVVESLAAPSLSPRPTSRASLLVSSARPPMATTGGGLGKDVHREEERNAGAQYTRAISPEEAGTHMPTRREVGKDDHDSPPSSCEASRSVSMASLPSSPPSPSSSYRKSMEEVTRYRSNRYVEGKAAPPNTSEAPHGPSSSSHRNRYAITHPSTQIAVDNDDDDEEVQPWKYACNGPLASGQSLLHTNGSSRTAPTSAAFTRTTSSVARQQEDPRRGSRGMETVHTATTPPELPSSPSSQHKEKEDRHASVSRSHPSPSQSPEAKRRSGGGGVEREGPTTTTSKTREESYRTRGSLSPNGTSIRTSRPSHPPLSTDALGPRRALQYLRKAAAVPPIGSLLKPRRIPTPLALRRYRASTHGSQKKTLGSQRSPARSLTKPADSPLNTSGSSYWKRKEEEEDARDQRSTSKRKTHNGSYSPLDSLPSTPLSRSPRGPSSVSSLSPPARRYPGHAEPEESWSRRRHDDDHHEEEVVAMQAKESATTSFYRASPPPSSFSSTAPVSLRHTAVEDPVLASVPFSAHGRPQQHVPTTTMEEGEEGENHEAAYKRECRKAMLISSAKEFLQEWQRERDPSSSKESKERKGGGEAAAVEEEDIRCRKRRGGGEQKKGKDARSSPPHHHHHHRSSLKPPARRRSSLRSSETMSRSVSSFSSPSVVSLEEVSGSFISPTACAAMEREQRRTRRARQRAAMAAGASGGGKESTKRRSVVPGNPVGKAVKPTQTTSRPLSPLELPPPPPPRRPSPSMLLTSTGSGEPEWIPPSLVHLIPAPASTPFPASTSPYSSLTATPRGRRSRTASTTPSPGPGSLGKRVEPISPLRIPTGDSGVIGAARRSKSRSLSMGSAKISYHPHHPLIIPGYLNPAVAHSTTEELHDDTVVRTASVAAPPAPPPASSPTSSSTSPSSLSITVTSSTHPRLQSFPTANLNHGVGSTDTSVLSRGKHTHSLLVSRGEGTDGEHGPRKSIPVRSLRTSSTAEGKEEESARGGEELANRQEPQPLPHDPNEFHLPPIEGSGHVRRSSYTRSPATPLATSASLLLQTPLSMTGSRQGRTLSSSGAPSSASTMWTTTSSAAAAAPAIRKRSDGRSTEGEGHHSFASRSSLVPDDAKTRREVAMWETGRLGEGEEDESVRALEEEVRVKTAMLAARKKALMEAKREALEALTGHLSSDRRATPASTSMASTSTCRYAPPPTTDRMLSTPSSTPERHSLLPPSSSRVASKVILTCQESRPSSYGKAMGEDPCREGKEKNTFHVAEEDEDPRRDTKRVSMEISKAREETLDERKKNMEEEEDGSVRSKSPPPGPPSAADLATANIGSRTRRKQRHQEEAVEGPPGSLLRFSPSVDSSSSPTTVPTNTTVSTISKSATGLSSSYPTRASTESHSPYRSHSSSNHAVASRPATALTTTPTSSSSHAAEHFQTVELLRQRFEAYKERRRKIEQESQMLERQEEEVDNNARALDNGMLSDPALSSSDSSRRRRGEGAQWKAAAGKVRPHMSRQPPASSLGERGHSFRMARSFTPSPGRSSQFRAGTPLSPSPAALAPSDVEKTTLRRIIKVEPPHYFTPSVGRPTTSPAFSPSRSRHRSKGSPSQRHQKGSPVSKRGSRCGGQLSSRRKRKPRRHSRSGLRRHQHYSSSYRSRGYVSTSSFLSTSPCSSLSASSFSMEATTAVTDPRHHSATPGGAHCRFVFPSSPASTKTGRSHAFPGRRTPTAKAAATTENEAAASSPRTRTPVTAVTSPWNSKAPPSQRTARPHRSAIFPFTMNATARQQPHRRADGGSPFASHEKSTGNGRTRDLHPAPSSLEKKGKEVHAAETVIWKNPSAPIAATGEVEEKKLRPSKTRKQRTPGGTTNVKMLSSTGKGLGSPSAVPSIGTSRLPHSASTRKEDEWMLGGKELFFKLPCQTRIAFSPYLGKRK